ncbi:MAG: AAA family ATPase [Candidatus Omnitrophica bacterium]|nr:AAA family ATPase [Candidatus Omnitrophota bacterium]
MKVIAVTNQKGGCGKTITSINLASALAGMGKKILLIDLDPQAHATMALGIDIQEPSESSYALFESFINKKEFDTWALTHNKHRNLSVIGSHISLSTIEQKITSAKDALRIFYNVVENKIPSEYDYVVVDTPPNLGFLTLNAILSADRLVIPIDVSIFSLNAVEQINKILEISEGMGFKKPEINFLITLFDGRSNFAKEFLQKTKVFLKGNLLSTIIRSNIKLREAVLYKKTIFEHALYANGAKDYASLAQEIVPELKGELVMLEEKAAVPQESGEMKALETFFKLHAPDAKNVYLVGTFNNWTVDSSYMMKRLEDGTWIKNVPLRSGTYYYKFIVDGKWREDPSNNKFENDKLGGRNSVLLVKTG